MELLKLSANQKQIDVAVFSAQDKGQAERS